MSTRNVPPYFHQDMQCNDLLRFQVELATVEAIHNFLCADGSELCLDDLADIDQYRFILLISGKKGRPKLSVIVYPQFSELSDDEGSNLATQVFEQFIEDRKSEDAPKYDVLGIGLTRHQFPFV